MLGTANRSSPSCFSAPSVDSAQTLSAKHLVFHSSFRSRVTSLAQRWRQRQSFNAVEDRGEQVSRHRHFGQLKEHVLRVPRHLGPDLHRFFPQRRRRPVPYAPNGRSTRCTSRPAKEWGSELPPYSGRPQVRNAICEKDGLLPPNRVCIGSSVRNGPDCQSCNPPGPLL